MKILLLLAVLGVLLVAVEVVAIVYLWRSKTVAFPLSRRGVPALMAGFVGVALAWCSLSAKYPLAFPDGSIMRILGIPFAAAGFDSQGGDFIGPLTSLTMIANAIVWFLFPLTTLVVYTWIRQWSKEGAYPASASATLRVPHSAFRTPASPLRIPRSAFRIPNSPLRILIVAGEVSGDMHAAALMHAMQTQYGAPIAFRGIGGDAMRAAGAELLEHTDRTAVIGVWDVLRHIGFFTRLLRDMERELETWQPDLVLTVDYPGFNLRLAARAHRRGFKTVHYISPKVWAWNRARIPRLARILDHLVTIFPFEAALFEGTGLRVTFAGHPLVDRAQEAWAAPDVALPWRGGHRVALLPGSRSGEIARLLPDMLAAAALLEKELGGDCSFIIPAPTSAMRRFGEEVAARAALKPSNFAFVDGLARQVMRQAHAAAMASGTATLEASLMRCPTVLVYRLPWLTYLAARLLVHGIKHAGLVNIIAGREVMPELLQRALTPAALAAQLKTYLTDASARNRVLREYDAVNATLGENGTAARAAAAVLATL